MKKRENLGGFAYLQFIRLKKLGNAGIKELHNNSYKNKKRCRGLRKLNVYSYMWDLNSTIRNLNYKILFSLCITLMK